MSEPRRITCRTAEDIPSVAQIQKLVNDQMHLVLRFPAESAIDDGARSDLLRQLAADLPECRVFDTEFTSGERYIVVKKLIAAVEVLQHAHAIVAAARQFRSRASDLMTELARSLDLPLEAFGNPLVRVQLQEDRRERGRLPSGWAYWFHGFECQLVRRGTGQTVEVRLGFYPEIGVLDPWFFKEFVETTPEFQSVAGLFKDYDDASHALKVLEQHGYLQRVQNPAFHQSGLIAREP